MALQISTKRLQLDRDKTMILVIVGFASVVAVAAIVIGKALWNQTNYLGRVADKKEVAVRTLEKNRQALAELTEAYETFDKQNPNLLGGSIDGTTDRDGTNAALVLEALPSKYDFPALTSSLEKLLSGHTITGINGRDDNVNQSSAQSSSYVEMPFTVGVVASYDGLKQLIDMFDRSIRPFKITRISVSGNSNSLQTTISATTYYQPETGLKITEETVR